MVLGKKDACLTEVIKEAHLAASVLCVSTIWFSTCE